jgi:uncharacterized integral membrane protein (TIGR00698 family)
MERQRALGAWAAVAIVLTPLVWYGNPAIALLAGTALSLVWRGRLDIGGQRVGRLSLQTAIVLLGASLSIGRVLEVSADNLALVASYVLGVLGFGLVLGRLMAVERVSRLLMTAGTAICGGTAIATLAPIVRARPDQVGVAIGIVFLLNAIALFTFPEVGHLLALSERDFGRWVAVAIHDTSSVVATAAVYGEEALRVATTVKLGRTLWLIPLALVVALASSEPNARVRVPGFIVAFLVVSVATSLLPPPDWVVHGAGRASKMLLVVALFFVGTEIRAETLRQMRGRVLVHAVLLWAVAAAVTLAAVRAGL